MLCEVRPASADGQCLPGAMPVQQWHTVATGSSRPDAAAMAQKILIVDDSSVIRLQYRLVLEQAGYEVVEAWDAPQAAAHLKRQEIAFLLCDLNIPGKNGLTLIEAMRKVPKLASIPAVIFTAEYSAELVERAKQAGVTSWLLKPCKADTLLELITKHVGPPAE